MKETSVNEIDIGRMSYRFNNNNSIFHFKALDPNFISLVYQSCLNHDESEV